MIDDTEHNRLLASPDRTIVLLINDYDVEYDEAMQKLSQELGRDLRGIILRDDEVESRGVFSKVLSDRFEVVTCDFEDDGSIARALNLFKDSILLVTCSDDKNQPYLKRIIPHLPDLLHPSSRSLDWATRKDWMRDMMSAYDSTLCPGYAAVFEYFEEEIAAIAEILTFPLIIKPTGLAGSVLVKKIHTAEELHEELRSGFDVISNIHKAQGGRGKAGFMIEEFIVGKMHSLDGYVDYDGNVYCLPLFSIKTEYDMGGNGFSSFDINSVLSLAQSDIEAANRTATSAATALNLRNCVIHVEMYLTDGGWKIIELGPRAGGQRQEMYMISYGVDHALNEFRIKVGKQPILPSALMKHLRAIKFPSPKEGVLRAIHDIESINELHTGVSYQQKAKIGDYVMTNEDGGKVLVKALFASSDADAIDRDVNTYRNRVVIDIE